MKIKFIKILSVCFFLFILYSFTTKTTAKKHKETIKVALLLDTSNSMDGLINQAKTQLWEIVNKLSKAKYGNQKPNLEIALYEYGNSSLAISDGYIRKVLAFSSDLDLISEKLFSLKTNGGSEYCGQVIKTSIDELSWGKNKNDLRLIFIAGNEPFTQGKINYKEAIAQAKEKDVVINTIYCGKYQVGINTKWEDGASIGGGDYMNIDQDKKIVHIVTPYDRDIIILNKKLNKTYIYYGTKGRTKQLNQVEQDNNAKELNEAVYVKRTISKGSNLYKNSSWDLVDAEKYNKVDYSKINKKNLPKHLKNKSVSEIKAYVKEQAKKRKEIQLKIKELDNKRSIFIAKKMKESPKGNILENAIINTIKKQAIKKNYSW